MNALIWLIAIAVGIVGAVLILSVPIAIFRKTKDRGFTKDMMPLLVMSIVLMIAWVISVSLFNPFIIGLVSLVGAIPSFFAAKKLTRNKDATMEVVKLSTSHVALLAGSFLFLIPFAWLISTSLKSDDEQATFPPVWIPTQQVTADTLKNTEGDPAPLSYYFKGEAPTDSVKLGETPTEGAPIQVAEVADLPTGEIRVQPVSMALDGTQVKTQGTAFVTGRDHLAKIRQEAPRWKNYSEALEFLPPETHYGLTFLGNTLFLTLMTVIGTLLSSSLVAYAFSRLIWPGRDLLFVVLLATMMIPGAVTMMPQFLIFRSLGWIDTLKPLWVPAFFGAPFNIFLLRQFFMSIPNELEDAAKIDGSGPLGTWWRIMLPQVKPALAAIGIMSVMGAWNSFQGPLIYLSSPDKMTLSYALQLYQQQHGGEPGLLMAASTLVVLPIIVLFFFTQRYFIEGVSLSGLGGR